MRYHFLAILSLLAMIAMQAPGQSPDGPPKSTAAKTKSAIPRTPDGHPDLQGVWTNATLTPLTRPTAFADKATISDEEARSYEKKDLDVNTLDSDVSSNFNRATGGPGVGAYNNLFVDRGSELARVDGVKRTSLIIDPPDGKMPASVGRQRTQGGGGQGEQFAGLSYDSVKRRPLSERCLIGFGSTSGPPMLPVLYNNNYEIVQTPGTIMILVEMVHDVRVIRMDGSPHLPGNVRKWLGDSIGHWEGDTLVVDTTNFTDHTHYQGASPDLHVIERFKRVADHTILYRFTIDDPKTFTKQWTAEYPFLATDDRIFEYACHEGNYAMPDILGGARKDDEAAKKGPTK